MNAPTPVQLAARGIFSASRIVPVVSLDDPEAGVALALALAEGGMPVIEMTLRSPNALKVAEAIARRAPQVLLGLGTILSAEQIGAAVSAGARFLVSPGVTPALAAAAANSPVPFLPGAATISEAMTLRELGFRTLKFFPAESSGGVAALKGFQPVLQDIAFCPTGGVDLAKAPAYLALTNVVGVGGSWIAPPALIAEGRFAEISGLARAAVALAG
jgi:2-dehydro-3-deoxyphosphogluconate aldolase/(4S)-4-hydroxy-2-oxoglutarate aldolase